MKRQIPPGTHLSIEQLAEAINYKLKHFPEKLDSAAAIGKIEERLLYALALLRGQHNALQPIHRLGPELLALTFDHIRLRLSNFLPNSTRTDWLNCRIDWLSLLHVCRHWRGVIASTPALWATIDCDAPYSDVLKSLKRSKAAPLTVFFGYRVTESLVRSVLEHSDRIKQFTCSMYDYRGETSFWDLLSPAMPKMESLVLTGRTFDDVSMFPSAVPRIFAGEMPSLERLSLTHFTSWPSTYFRGLTHLCLHDQDPLTRPSTAAFLDILDASPELEVLAMVNAGPTRDTAVDHSPVSSSRKVSLPNLRRIDFGEWMGVKPISRLLTHLSLPSETSILVWGESLLVRDDHLGLLFPPDASSHLKSLSEVRKWVFDRAYQGGLSRFSCVHVSNGILHTAGPWTVGQICPLTSTFPLAGVLEMSVLDVIGSEKLSTEVWADIFDHLPLLESMSVRVFTSYGMISLRPMLDALQQDRRGGLGGLYAPHLRRLEFQAREETFPQLGIASFLRWRSRRKGRIEKLDVYLAEWLTRLEFYNGRPIGRETERDPEQRAITEGDLSVLKKYVKEVKLVRSKKDSDFPECKILPSRGQIIAWTRPELWDLL